LCCNTSHFVVKYYQDRVSVSHGQQSAFLIPLIRSHLRPFLFADFGTEKYPRAGYCYG